MIALTSSIESAPKISRRIVPALKRLGVKTIRDLLFHFPRHYEDFSNQKAIADVAMGETVTMEGKIQRVSGGRTIRKRIHLTEAVISDATGRISAVWFNQPHLARNLKLGGMVRLSGKIARGPKGTYLQNPAYEKILNQESGIRNQGIHTAGLIPVYPETSGITSRWLRFLIKSFIELRHGLAEPLPGETRERHGLPPIAESIQSIHFPKTVEDATAAERRFIFEDLLLFQLRSLRERSRLKQHDAPAIPFDLELAKKFVQSLPYRLTNAQRRSIYEIAKDLEKPRPMNRLLEGDVGSGKTVVAAAASLLAVKAGYRVAFMAPTEILARQHLTTLQKVLEPFNVSIGILLGSEKKKRDAEIVAGTHALIQKNAVFENLGLVVIDEQHRFGVEQRARLTTNYKLKTTNSQKMLPHFLSMSATPIPRTLALTIYGDLDLSVLDEMPPTRKSVITKIVEPGKRAEAYQFIHDEVRKGRQVFVICPRIDPPNHESGIRNQESRRYQQRLLLTEVKTVTEEYKKLAETVFPDLRIAMLHGRMKSKEKEAVMEKFRRGETDILVSTSVIEVGVDVPNAAIMMIEGAERFGLAQLHQFRGRVGRGTEQSYCFLFPTEDGIETRRLKAVVEAKTGFELAEEDLKIRGPGQIFGTQQWGAGDLALKGLTDPKLVRAVRQEAVALAKKSPDLTRYPALRGRLEEWGRAAHLE